MDINDPKENRRLLEDVIEFVDKSQEGKINDPLKHLERLEKRAKNLKNFEMSSLIKSKIRQYHENVNFIVNNANPIAEKIVNAINKYSAPDHLKRNYN
jgi:hypothetical protein